MDVTRRLTTGLAAALAFAGFAAGAAFAGSDSGSVPVAPTSTSVHQGMMDDGGMMDDAGMMGGADMDAMHASMHRAMASVMSPDDIAACDKAHAQMADSHDTASTTPMDHAAHHTAG